jgi:uncharacterized protein YihD (DUF1040 family)
MKQTAVEWLIQQLSKEWQLEDRDLHLIEQAKEMEKEQIINACIYEFADDYDTAIEYYYETFKSE